MAPKSKRKCIADALEDLEPEELEKFRRQLLDRKEEPRVRRARVNGKSYLEIADVLVSTFNEDRAVKETEELLKEIGCLDAAKELEQETKSLLDKGGRKRKTKPSPAKAKPTSTKAKPTPTKVKPSSTKTKRLPTKAKPSPTKAKPSTTKTKRLPTKAKPTPTKAKPSTTKTERLPTKAKPSTTKTKRLPTKTKPSPAKAKPSPTKKSRNTIKFGKYKGKTFEWLLKNDVDYTAYIVVSHQKELEGATESKMPQNQLMANKDALTEYVSAFPEVLEKVRSQRAYMEYKEAAKSGQEGKLLVGFGAYRSETLEDLYESNDQEKINYVKYLRTMELTCDPGSKMEFAINYILKRDKVRAAATKRQINSSTARASTKKRTSESCVQSNSSQPTNDSGPIRKKQKRSSSIALLID